MFKLFIFKNSTSGSQNVTFKYVSGSGDTVAVSPATTKIVFASANDGTFYLILLTWVLVQVM